MAKSVRILGVRVDNVDWSDVTDFCRDALNQSSPRQIVTVNGEFILEAQKNHEFREIINNADLVIPDSTNVVWVSRILGTPLRAITPGSDLVCELSDLAAKDGHSIFLLGGQEGIAHKAGERLQQINPGLKITGTSHADPDDPYVLKHIRDSGADIVIVAYGSPRQEEWIGQHKNELGAKILVGIGGTFDMLAGVTPRAPRVLRALHLEWLWRLILQPRRFGRIWKALVIFPLKAIFTKTD